ncbi:MAG: phosphomannomutase/phosphoglucomutase [Candidatus Brocadiales bacterium]|nr:phosphomannomutase/phosphoglucomutase [Candidatus Brocadiales bacterium]
MVEKEARRCPGDKYTITVSICRARQKRRYPKCGVCEYREIELTPAELESRSIRPEIFKGYDVRGIYPDELNEIAARRIGSAFAQFLKQQKGIVKNIVVGKDMRKSSTPLAHSLMEGITSSGVNVIDIGTVSTETVNFTVANFGYDGGVAVTASHNPAAYNGFKFCREQAIPVGSDTGLSRVQELARLPSPRRMEPLGRVIQKDVLEDYKKHIQKFARQIKPLRLVVDAGNGMAGKMVPLVFQGLPCEIIPLYFELDGSFPNHEADPLKVENLRALQEKVRETRAHLGAAFDGDADRCTFVDEKGEAVKPDLITALIAREFLLHERGATIIYDLRSSWAVREEILINGGVPCRERVGHAFIKATMREKNAVFGGELSGHYYFRDNYYADSGIIALIQVLNILSRKSVSMSNLVAPLKKYFSTGEMNFTVEDKDGKLQRLAEAFPDGKIDYVDGVTVEYKDWWFNCRKSQTEPRLRLNIEGKNRDLVETAMKKITGIIKDTR